MARTVKDVRLDNRAARERLEPRKKPYYRVIETAKHLGYYRGSRGGSWLARTYDGTAKKYLEKTLGAADDTCDANGLDVLSFSQAQAAARQWFDELARIQDGGHVGPYSVGQACDDYLKEYLARDAAKDEANTRSRLTRIKAALGAIEVRKLTAQQIKDWHRGLSELGTLTRNQTIDESTGERRRRPIDANDAEAKRRRAASANRMLTVLKAALNQAFKNQEALRTSIPTKTAWQSASPTRAVDAPKISYLKEDETIRLLNACPSDFRDLAHAALLTGARYGELCRFRVRDFDASAASIRVEISKSGKPRSIALTVEGVALFERRAAGKARDNLLLTRSDGEAWLASHQLRRMSDACKAASIVPGVSFHILRHTYGSRLAMRGAPMPVIAIQLGHSDTRITERHYAHLGPSYVSDVVRNLLGTIGGAEPDSNVVSLGSGAAGTTRSQR